MHLVSWLCPKLILEKNRLTGAVAEPCQETPLTTYSCVSLNNYAIWSSDTQFPLSKRKKITQVCLQSQLQSRFYNCKKFEFYYLNYCHALLGSRKLACLDVTLYSWSSVIFWFLFCLCFKSTVLTHSLRVFITSCHTCVSLNLDMNYLRTKTTLPIPWMWTPSNAL